MGCREALAYSIQRQSQESEYIVKDLAIRQEKKKLTEVFLTEFTLKIIV